MSSCRLATAPKSRSGDRVPADGRLIACHDLEADESLLTGKSIPARKMLAAQPPAKPDPGGDNLPFVYSGSVIVRGQGVAEVTATGPRSEIGKIGRSLSTIEDD